MQIPGMLTIEDLRRRVDESQIDTVLLTFTDIYGRQFGKRLDARFFLEGGDDAGHARLRLPADHRHGDGPVAGLSVRQLGARLRRFPHGCRLATLRVASWLDRTALVTCDVLQPNSHAFVEQAPRSILRRQIERALGKMGYQPMAGSELEYYIFNNSYRQAAAAGYNGLEPAGWYLEDYHVLQGTREEKVERRGPAAPGAIGHSRGMFQRRVGQGPARTERAIQRRPDDGGPPCRVQAVPQRSGRQPGMSVTFMAKPDAAQAGSSCHVHMSLWQDGGNIDGRRRPAWAGALQR